jgi:hypothetical protein
MAILLQQRFAKCTWRIRHTGDRPLPALGCMTAAITVTYARIASANND